MLLLPVDVCNRGTVLSDYKHASLSAALHISGFINIVVKLSAERPHILTMFKMLVASKLFSPGKVGKRSRDKD